MDDKVHIKTTGISREDRFMRVWEAAIYQEAKVKVIVINGPMGVGKTTVGRYIADACAGTAFIDGDWCMDIHPFVGNSETKEMAVDNILHMIDNYRKCSACRQIVLVWLMDDRQIRQKIREGIAGMQLEMKSVTLVCDEKQLIDRWKNDNRCDWRTEEWLKVSLRSLDRFASLEDAFETNEMSVKEIAEAIIK